MPSTKRIVIRVKIGYANYILHSILTITLITLIYFYDQQVLYHTVIPLRYIFDLGLFILIYIPIYSIFKNILFPKYKEQMRVFYLTKRVIKIVCLINILPIFNTLRLDNPTLGILKMNMLTQGLEALPYYTLYLLICLTNGFMLFVISRRNDHISAYDIFVHSTVFMALQTLVSVYGFHIVGLTGLRIFLISLFVVLSILYIYQIHKSKVQRIVLEMDEELLYVLIISLTTFTFYYFHALYNHYSDQAVILANTNSILYRGSLEPYYKVCGYYPAIGGFYVTSFIYITGLNNVILASTLSFMVALMFLPIIVYRFMKLLINNGSIALLATVMTVFMDGLGTLAYPIYKPLIDKYLCCTSSTTYNWNVWYILSFRLSIRTCSLYASNVSHLWFNPYKVFAMLFSASSVVMLSYSQLTMCELVFTGILLSISFIHPKATPSALLSFMLLWGFKKVKSLKDALIPVLMSIIVLGPLTQVILYKIIREFIRYFLVYVCNLSLKDHIGIITTIEYILKNYFTHSFIVLIILITFIIYCKIRTPSSKNSLRAYTPLLKTSSSRLTLIFIILSFITLAFITFYIHNLSSYPLLKIFLNSHTLFILRYLILRYHVMIVLLVLTLAFFKLDFRLILSITLVLCAIYILGLNAIYLPIPLLIIGIPTLNCIIKQKSNIIAVILLLIFLVLGILTNGLYGVLITSLRVDSIYEDLPHIVPILLKYNSSTRVYPGSYYNYFVERTLSFAQLSSSSDLNESELCLIDKQYGIRIVLENYSNRILYSGKRLILIKLKG